MHKVLDAKFIAPVKSTETSENNISSVLLSDFICVLHVNRIVVDSMEMLFISLWILNIRIDDFYFL